VPNIQTGRLITKAIVYIINITSKNWFIEKFVVNRKIGLEN